MKLTAEIQQLGTFTYGTLLAGRRWEQRTVSISPALSIIVIFQNLRSCLRLIMRRGGGRNEPHKIKLREIWKRRLDSERGDLPSVRPWTPDPTPAVWSTVWVKSSIWRGDIPTKFGGNVLVVRLHWPLKDFLSRPGSALQDVGALGGRHSVRTPSFQSWRTPCASALAAPVRGRCPHPMLGLGPHFALVVVCQAVHFQGDWCQWQPPGSRGCLWVMSLNWEQPGLGHSWECLWVGWYQRRGE